MSDSTTTTQKTETPYDDLVLVDRRDGYAILTINRPEKRNAMSTAAVKRLRQAFDEVRDARAVILTGTGPSFCAGMDLKEAAAQGASQPDGGGDKHVWTSVQEEIRSHPAVFIAAVNGYALGGGSTLIHSCDLAYAAESASIAAPEMGFGGFPSHAAPAAIKRLSPKHAFELIFTARRVSAHDALRMSIVNKVVPDEQLLPEAIALAEQLAGFNPVAIDWGKQAFHAMEDLTWDEAMKFNHLNGLLIRARSTALEDGLKAFNEGKRGVGQGA